VRSFASSNPNSRDTGLLDAAAFVGSLWLLTHSILGHHLCSHMRNQILHLLALMHSFVKQEVLALALPLLASRRILRIRSAGRNKCLAPVFFATSLLLNHFTINFEAIYNRSLPLCIHSMGVNHVLTALMHCMYYILDFSIRNSIPSLFYSYSKPRIVSVDFWINLT
jgi:hypothetical protein